MVDMAEIWRGFAEDLTTAPIAFAGHLPRCPLVTQPQYFYVAETVSRARSTRTHA